MLLLFLFVMCDPAKVLASIRTFREIQAKLSRKTFFIPKFAVEDLFLKNQGQSS